MSATAPSSKGVNFVGLREMGEPAVHARFYNDEGADELVILDITASREERRSILHVVESVADVLFIPLTVGGGIRTAEDVRDMLNAGADRVSLNTAMVQRPALIEEAAARFGSQCVVAAIDARRKADGNGWEVFIYGGHEATGLDALAWAKEVEARGAGEILLTSMDRDGTQSGYDIALLQELTSRVRIPVIASGGAGTLSHFSEGSEGRRRQRGARRFTVPYPRAHHPTIEILSPIGRSLRTMNLEQVRFDEHGLIPAVVQDALSGEVLMLAYMNRESLEKTIATGETHFWSRSRKELWHKGATSGHIQKVVALSLDCDGDTILVRAVQTGAACHTGAYSCFQTPDPP